MLPVPRSPILPPEPWLRTCTDQLWPQQPGASHALFPPQWVMLAASSAGSSTAAAKQRPYGFEEQMSLMVSLSWKPNAVIHSSPLASSKDQFRLLCSGLSPAEHSVGKRTEGPLLPGQLGEEVPEPDSFLLLSSEAGCGASSRGFTRAA